MFEFKKSQSKLTFEFLLILVFLLFLAKLNDQQTFDMPMQAHPFPFLHQLYQQPLSFYFFALMRPNFYLSRLNFYSIHEDSNLMLLFTLFASYIG